MKTETAEVVRPDGATAAPPAEAAGGAPGPPGDPPAEAAAAPACPSCGETLAGDFCHRCGEKRLGARDLSVRHFVGEALQEFTSVEHSKIFRTLRALLFRPGFLTLEWVAGRRNQYLKPLSLCLGIFALNLFVYSVYREVSMFNFGRMAAQERQMIEQLKLPGRRPKLIEERVGEAAARQGVTREHIYETINERWHRYFSLLQLPQILVFALLLQILYIFWRRYFVEHLVFSLHFLAFTSLTVVLMWPIYFWLGIDPTPAGILTAVAKFLLDVFYLFVAARRVYREPAVLAVIRAFVMFVGYLVIYLVMYVIAMTAASIPIIGG